MFPALGCEGVSAVRRDERDQGACGVAAKNTADAGNGNPGDRARYPGGGGRREEQFIVFATVERLHQRGGWMDGQRGGVDLDRDAGLLAEMAEVRREAVADVDGRGGAGGFGQPLALRNAWFRIKMRFEQSVEPDGNAGRAGAAPSRTGGGGKLSQPCEARSRAAQRSCDVEKIAGTRTGSEERSSTGDGAGEDDVGDGDGRFRKVAACQRSLVTGSEREQSVKKAVDPAGLTLFRLLDQAGRQAKREECGEGARPHGGQVAEPASEGTVADGFGRVPIKAEMALGDGKVGGYGKLFRAWQAE